MAGDHWSRLPLLALTADGNDGMEEWVVGSNATCHMTTVMSGIGFHMHRPPFLLSCDMWSNLGAVCPMGHVQCHVTCGTSTTKCTLMLR